MIKFIILLFLICLICPQANSGFNKTLLCQCMVSKRYRLSYGFDIGKKEFRFLASLYIGAIDYDVRKGQEIIGRLTRIFQKHCTVSIISPRWVISAYRCLTLINSVDIVRGKKIRGYVAAGHNKSLEYIINDRRHAKVVKDKYQLFVPYDVGLVELEGKGFKIGEEMNIYPACLVNKRIDSFGLEVLHLGYGLRNEFSLSKGVHTVGKFKRKVSKKYHCSQHKLKKFKALDTDPPFPRYLKARIKDGIAKECENFATICTHSSEGSACPGDTGGPVVAVYKSYYVLIGVLNSMDPIDGSLRGCNNRTYNFGTLINFRFRLMYGVVQKFFERIRELTDNEICTINVD